MIKPTLIKNSSNETQHQFETYTMLTSEKYYLSLMRGGINKIAQCVMQLGVGTVDRRVSIYPLELDSHLTTFGKD